MQQVYNIHFSIIVSGVAQVCAESEIEAKVFFGAHGSAYHQLGGAIGFEVDGYDFDLSVDNDAEVGTVEISHNDEPNDGIPNYDENANQETEGDGDEEQDEEESEKDPE